MPSRTATKRYRLLNGTPSLSASGLLVPRPGPRRPLVAVRLSNNGIKNIDHLAEARGVTRSEMIRVMLAYATLKMPRDWQPVRTVKREERV
jgi:Ribbon-helix-helix protein, copG family